MDQSAPDELELQRIERARRGDAGAFVELVRHYQTPVYNLAYRMLGNSTDAEDAAQETFLRAYTRLLSFDRSRRFATWLLGITAHYCIDRLRRQRFSGPSLDDQIMQETLASDLPRPEESVLAGEQRAEAERLLAELPPAYRVVVVLKYWNDMSVDEIARATGDKAGAVKVRLFRARQAMARSLARRDNAPVVNTRVRAGEGV